jgi:hypothetical protein
LRRLEEAVASFDRALAIRPDNAKAHYNRGNALNELKRFDEALVSCDRAIALNSNLAEAFNNRGNALRDLMRLEDAVASYDRAIALKPDYIDAMNNRGVALMELKRIDDALESYDRAIAIKNDYAEGHWNRGLCHLLAGNCIEGWADYEWRWKTDQMTRDRRGLGSPQWFGDGDIAGKTILLHTEQGFGDSLMAARYVRRVINKGAHVILETPAALQALFAEIEGVAQVVTKGEPLPSFDLHCPLMSLPLAFATTLTTIPAETPYLSVPQAHLQNWRRRLPTSGKLRVGVSWAGNPDFKRDRGRSIGLPAMQPLLLPTDVELFSIHKVLRPGDAEILRDHPHIIHLGDSIETFADTAAIMSTLDLVISSDTSVVHLAGALGKPVWVLLQFVPDWRWLLDRDDCPWYPTARLFRQASMGDWDGVVRDASEALSRLAARHSN